MITASVLKYLLIPIAAAVSASAQLLLKKTSMCSYWGKEWFLWLGGSGVLYVVSMFLYMYLLRRFPISKIYPALTTLVILSVNIYGYLVDEPVTIKHMAGVAIGLLSIYLMLN